MSEKFKTSLNNVEKIKDLLSITTTTPDSFNKRLIEEQELTPSDLQELCRLHDQKNLIFRKFKETRSRKDYKALVDELEAVEFAMQRAWKFTEDRNYHTWWCAVPKCKCEPSGRGNPRTINPSCPIHRK